MGVRLLRGPGAAPSEEEKNARKGEFRSWLDRLGRELGLLLPEVEADLDPTLQENEFRVRLNDVRLPAVRALAPDEFVVATPAEDLIRLGLSGRSSIDPFSGAVFTVVKNAQDALGQCRQGGLTTWTGPLALLMAQLDAAARLNAGSFLTMPVVQFMIDQLKDQVPDVIQLVRRRVDTTTLTAVLRDLLDEQVPVRDLRATFEALLAIREVCVTNQRTLAFFSRLPSDSVLLAEGKRLGELEIHDYSACVRLSLKSLPLGYSQTARGSTSPQLLLVDARAERRLLQASKQPLQEDESRRFRQAVLRALNLRSAGKGVPVVLSSQENRRRVRELIEIEFPTLTVLGSQEILPGRRQVQPMQVISW